MQSSSLPCYRQNGWWFEQIRREGSALSLDKLAGPCQKYIGVASVITDSQTNSPLNTVGHLQSVRLNGKRVYLNSGRWAGFHAGREKIPISINAGPNSIVIETCPQFSLSIAETRYW